MDKVSAKPGVTRGLHVIALFEAAKGALVLIAGLGLLSLVHHDLQDAAEHLVRLSHLNPARHYPRVFVEAASKVDDGRLKQLAALAFLYTSVRFIEAYGLWKMRAWAEWFAIASGAIYLPLEIYELFKQATILRVLVLILNAGIVTYLIYVRWLNRRLNKEATRISTGDA
ncbi:MAG: DUF2127 domain-containing protein [Pyrinomonadaceae bacterium]